MKDLLKMGRVQLLILVVFVIGKLIRPSVLASGAPEFFKVFLLSFPNFCEGVIGVTTLTILGLYVNRSVKMKYEFVYVLAGILAIIFVLTQEFKIHNLGGENVFDPMDAVFSCIGVAVGLATVFWVRPRMLRA